MLLTNSHRCAKTVRLLTSSKWEDTLGAFAVVFSSHKEDLHKDLVLLTASEVKAASITLDVVHEKVTKADLHFELLRSPEERQLLEFIERRGGAQEVSGDEGLRQELDMLIERIGADREDRLISRVANLWEGVGDNLQNTFTGLFHQNQDSFERKFQLGLSRFEDVLVTAIRQVSHDRTAGSYYSEITDAVRIGRTAEPCLFAYAVLFVRISASFGKTWYVCTARV